MKSKRGAIELSMTTIIVIVLGVMLLGLGIAWVTGLFSQIEDLTQQSFAKAQQTIQEDMPSGDKFYIAGFSFEAKAGDYSEIYTGIRWSVEDDQYDTNGDGKLYFTLGVIPEEKSNWFLLPQATLINAGEKKGLPLGIRVPKEEGSEIHSFTLVAKVSDTPDGQFSAFESEAIIIEVK